jgi:hypothetical protein
MEGVGQHLEEWSFSDKHEYREETIKKFQKFFSAMPEEVQNEIIITGTVNLLFNNFSNNARVMKFILNYLLKAEKKKLIRKKFVRFK